MNASEIEVFLVLAEELHFTRTAERLYLAQSRVSRLVSSLERRIGGALFDRTSRRVTLTPLGERLRDRAEFAWTELEAALAEAQAMARNVNGTLRLGWPVTASGPALALLAEAFSASCPDCELAIQDVPVTDPYGPLRRSEIDVLAWWLAGNEADLTQSPVIEFRDRVLAMGRGHRLAARESVSVEDLAEEETLDRPPSLPAAVFDVLVPLNTPSGRAVARTMPWRGVAEATSLIARGRIVHPTVAGVQLYQRDDIRLVPIRDLPPMPLGLTWRTAHENARIRALATVARRIGPSCPGPRPPVPHVAALEGSVCSGAAG